MANNCTVTMNIVLSNNKEQLKLFNYLDKIVYESNRKDIGCQIGDRTYLFDGEVFDHTENEIMVVGWVKYGIRDDEFVSIFKKLNQICFIQKFTVKLFESGNGVCEEYKYCCDTPYFIKHKSLDVETVLKFVQQEIDNDEHSAMYNSEDALEKVNKYRYIQFEE